MGSDVTMQCGSLDSTAAVTWKVNGTDVRARHQQDGPQLVLLEVDLSSNGLYSCFQEPNGERRDQINLRIGSESCSIPPLGLPPPPGSVVGFWVLLGATLI